MTIVCGGHLDLRDAAALLELGDRATLIRDVGARIDDVRPDVRDVWRALRSTLPAEPSD